MPHIDPPLPPQIRVPQPQLWQPTPSSHAPILNIPWLTNPQTQSTSLPLVSQINRQTNPRLPQPMTSFPQPQQLIKSLLQPHQPTTEFPKIKTSTHNRNKNVPEKRKRHISHRDATDVQETGEYNSNTSSIFFNSTVEAGKWLRFVCLFFYILNELCG